MSRTRGLLSAATSVAIVLGACADAPTVGPGDDPTPPEAQRYEADGMVLESREHGPEFCLGVINDSLPPQCSGLPLVDWDWEAVDGEDSAQGAAWGAFHLVGTYDGNSFTVLEVAVPEPPASDAPDFTAPCPEPTGGWVATDPARASDADLQAVMRSAEGEPDSAGFWIDYVGQPSETTPPGEIVAVAAFTGDLERHERELREVWGGPLCVTRHERTLAELHRIQAEFDDEIGRELGLITTWSAGNVVENLVEFGVVVADEVAVAAVEERYGAGSVLLVPALEPVAARRPGRTETCDFLPFATHPHRLARIA